MKQHFDGIVRKKSGCLMRSWFTCLTQGSRLVYYLLSILTDKNNFKTRNVLIYLVPTGLTETMGNFYFYQYFVPTGTIRLAG